MLLEDFHTALYQAHLLYGIELEEDEFEEIGLIAWNRIGNKRTRLYRYRCTVPCDKDYVELPCNCLYIEAVTADDEDWNYTTNYSNWGDPDTAYVEHYVESLKIGTNPFYTHGHFLKYQLEGNRLYFEKRHPGHVNILYHGIIADEDGLPMITTKEADAIAAFVAYTFFYKLGLSTKNGADILLAQDLERKYKILFDSARVPEHLTQNEMDEILDAKYSWARKTYGRSFKPLIR